MVIKMKGKAFRIVPMFLILVMLASALVGCATQQEEQATTRTITDMTGATIQVPAHIEKIVITCGRGVVQNLLLLGASDKIVACSPEARHFKMLTRINSKFESLPTVGEDEINMEELLKIGPDVVISEDGRKWNEEVESLGIPVIKLPAYEETSIEGKEREILMYGKLVGKEDVAEAFIQYCQEKLKKIDNITSTIPEGERRKVYCMSESPLHVQAGYSFENTVIERAGGINVAENIKRGGATVSLEQVILWNPDVIIQFFPKETLVGPEELVNEPVWASISAVKNEQIYPMPVGAGRWCSGCPEFILGIQWHAKIFYPEKFEDLDIKNETKDLYSKFYHYNLSNEEIQVILSGEGEIHEEDEGEHEEE